MEEEIIEAFVFHQHLLRRFPKVPASTNNWCYGCLRFFLPGEAIYGCSHSDCQFRRAFHQECLEMPREIRHHVHPSHTLTLLQDSHEIHKCAVCDWGAYGMIYLCSGGCELRIHMGCAVGFEDVADDEDKKYPPMEHPSHPRHPLRFSNKTRLLSFSCDACGTSSEKGNSYICSICNYWIHESCASLPASAGFLHHPDHSLSLAFHPPYEYIRYRFECAICSGALRLKSWVYHCQLCRYVVHIKCATDTSLVAPSNFCEGQMYPKIRMYHCRDCNQSFHCSCFPATSGLYRNINFGRQQYVITTIHHPNHLLRFQIISKKKRCDLCHRDAYDEPGFQCVSCNFVMCLKTCSVKHINDLKAID